MLRQTKNLQQLRSLDLVQNKILVIALGGTIGSVKSDSISLDSNNLKILDYADKSCAEFVGTSPFSVLSENMTIDLWKRLISFVDSIDFSAYRGVIILHGSDTLAFTSSIIANAFPSKKIVFVASDKPIEDSTSNGIKNFNNAVELILNGDICCPMVSYNGIFYADAITSANIHDEFIALDTRIAPVNSKNINDKNILVVYPYVNINPNNYNLENVDAVLIAMYHSATVPQNIVEFSKQLEKKGIEYHFVTHKASADYETASTLKNIIFNSTVENAYAQILLK